MLKSIRLRNLRAFKDTGKVDFHRLNVFIGPNNAGKTTFTNAIELFMHSLRSSARGQPLAFSSMPMFSSFDAVVRRHWSRKETRPNEIALSCEWQADEGQVVTSEFTCSGDAGSNATYVSRAKYIKGERTATVTAVKESGNVLKYRGTLGNEKFASGEVFFQNMWPFFQGHSKSDLLGSRISLQFFGDASWFSRRQDLEVVKPFRPVPRSYYVLNDPNLDVEERELVTYLANLWEAKEGAAEKVKSRIEDGLRELSLTKTFSVVRIVPKRGPAVLEIRVAPHSSRQLVTIADAGFGLSQVLPLIVSDARLAGGTLVAYQPEVHLHPFAQSRLADIFSTSLQRKNQIFVESHSPDLILRLQYLVANGSIAPSDLAVFCFENKNGKPAMRKITFDANAKPNFPWPSGFLDTSLSLARELAAARMKRASS